MPRYVEDARLTRRAEIGWEIILSWARTEFATGELVDALCAGRTRRNSAKVTAWRILFELRVAGLIEPIAARGKFRLTRAGVWYVPVSIVRATGAEIARGRAEVNPSFGTLAGPDSARGRSSLGWELWMAYVGHAPRELAFLPELLSDPKSRASHPTLLPPMSRTLLAAKDLRTFERTLKGVSDLMRRRPELSPYFLRFAINAVMQHAPAVVVAYPTRSEPLESDGWVLRPEWQRKAQVAGGMAAAEVQRAWESLRACRAAGRNPRRVRAITKYLRQAPGSRLVRGLG